MSGFLSYYRGAHTADKAYNFMGFSLPSLILSLILIFTFTGVYIYRYYERGQGFNYSVEFTGGIQTLVQINKQVKGEDLVRILEAQGWPGVQTRQFSSNEFLVRVKQVNADVSTEAENIRLALENGLGSDYTVNIKQTDSIGSATGSRLWTSSFYAIVISLVLMLVYIAIRFLAISYAAGAVISLFHDALAILTVFLLFDKEISINVIGAILAVLGYSINDTIVIFSRIRENASKMPNSSMRDIINISITETLSRTILTTFATLLVVISLFVFGGETLRDLSLALLVGIIFGIYSTIFIATPVLLWFYPEKHKAA